MAIQPSDRSAGSVHVLRFVGNIILAADPEAPGNAEIATPPVANTAKIVSFYLADLTDLTDLARQLPASVYDDTQPAGAAPHTPTTLGGPVDTTAVDPTQPGGMTWSQNLRVRVQENGATPDTPLLQRVEVLEPLSRFDPTLDVPVVLIPFYFTAAGIAAIGDDEAPGAGVPVIVEIEVPYTPVR